MEVAFSIGPKSLAVINTLKTLADNINFHTYPDIHSMVKESMIRHISFDRIVFSTTLLDKSDDMEGELRELNDFIRNYSDSTSIVMIVNHSGEEDKVFSKIFDSPMYTPVIMGKTTPKNLLELVTEDIINLKTKYYVLDVDKDKTIVSSAEVKKDEKKETPLSEKKKKGGFLSSLMGGKKKQPETDKSTEEIKQPAEDTSSTTESFADELGDFSSGPKSVFSGFGGESIADSNVQQNNSRENLFNSHSDPSLVGFDKFESDNSETSEEDDALSLGEMGAEHTDTGFLDEEEEKNDEELQEYIRNTQTDQTEKGDLPSKESELFSIVDREIPNQEVENSTKAVNPDLNIKEEEVKNAETVSSSNIDIIIGVHGSGSTSAIVNEAMDLVQSRGAKVLIIDLDYIENGLLSFIDTESFYTRGYVKGITRRRVYTEDGVDIMSNGYGNSISTNELLVLLRSSIVKTYDEVLIDCPAECLDIISKEILKLCNILVFTNTDRSDLISTTLCLTDRGTVSLDVERKIMKSCVVDCPEGRKLSKEDISYIKDNCLFANGCWLDNYE